MKRLILISVFVVGCLIHSYSQSKNEIELSTVNLTEEKINSEFLQTVQKKSTPVSVLQIQEEAAVFDVRQAADLKGSGFYEVLFKNNKGNFNAFYDKGGVISFANGRFYNVRMPKNLIKQIMRENDGWKIVQNRFHTSYKKPGESKDWYLVTLTNGVKSKNIKVLL